MKNTLSYPAGLPGLYTLGLRLVIGWTYFSAFWRRTILADKLDPNTAGYIGEKFNHFLPQALGIKPMIEHLLLHPDTLWWAMFLFTLIEGIVGLLLMLGFFTRLMSLGVVGLAFGILLGSGWLGTTCLDEWQIGVLGMAGGFALFWSGGGELSLDHWMKNKFHLKGSYPLLSWLISGELPVSSFKKPILAFSFLVFGFTLYTNQTFHGGVWGKLHNLSIRPQIEIEQAQLKNDSLHIEIYRTEGADVYGSFLIGIELLDDTQNTLWKMDNEELAALPETDIHNRYISKVKPGKHSLVIPLGAKAELRIPVPTSIKERSKEVRLTDISGIQWTRKLP